VLAIDSGPHAGNRLQLVPEVCIGRSDACELVLDDDYVSSVHAQLNHRSDGAWVLRDMGSTNGTFVNSSRITEPTVVTPDDVIRIGDVQMRLEF
jgi:pSer/pThr/pTyr-binding forkhead associated (FHA) protein